MRAASNSRRLLLRHCKFTNIIESEKSRLIAERSTYAEETEAARKEKETALQEAAEAKAQRDANRKDALSNLANRFTVSKTKRLEAELTKSREEIRTLKERAEQTAKAHSDQMWNLRQQLDRQKEQHESIVRGHQAKMDLIQKFFPRYDSNDSGYRGLQGGKIVGQDYHGFT